MKRWALSAIAAMLLSAGSARAQRVGVISYAAADAPAEARELARALAAVGRELGLRPVPAPFSAAKGRLAEGAVLRQRLAPFSRARQLLEEGWRSYLEVRPTFAAARLAEARRRALEVADLQDGRALLAEISLRLGAVKLALGRDGEAADDFRLAHDLAPGRAVTDAEFKPQVVTAYRAAADEARDARRRPLAVEPSRAAIEIDGKEGGRAPSEVKLEQGLHLVLARAAGYRPQALLVDARADGAIEMKLERDTLQETVLQGAGALTIGLEERAAARAMEALATYAELDGILLAAVLWRRGAPALVGQWCAGAPIRCGGVVELGYTAGGLEAAAAELWRQVRAEKPRRFRPTLQADARLTDPEPPPGVAVGTTPRARSRWWKSPWLWAGVGGTALGITAALILGGDQELRPAPVVDPSDF